MESNVILGVYVQLLMREENLTELAMWSSGKLMLTSERGNSDTDSGIDSGIASGIASGIDSGIDSGIASGIDSESLPVSHCQWVIEWQTRTLSLTQIHSEATAFKAY